jgi:hypothetical protein
MPKNWQQAKSDGNITGAQNLLSATSFSTGSYRRRPQETILTKQLSAISLYFAHCTLGFQLPSSSTAR